MLVFSVGGGNAEKKVSTNIVAALDLAKERGASIFGIVGRDGGHTAAARRGLRDRARRTFADHITPHTEGLCCVIWHLLVSHPALAREATKWESVV